MSQFTSIYTFEEHIQQEQHHIDALKTIYAAEIKYIEDYIHTLMLLPQFLPIKDASLQIFLGFYSQIYRGLTKASLDFLRGQHISSEMQLRYVIEASYLGAYSIHNFKKLFEIHKENKTLEEIGLIQFRLFGLSELVPIR